jgi:hypothetical protein
MLPTISTARLSRRTIVAAAATVAALAATTLASSTVASAKPAAPAHTAAAKAAPTKQQLLHPTKKYYGVAVAGAPGSLSGVTGSSNSVTSETGKQPNLLMFYEAWNGNAASGKSNINTKSIAAACAQGLLPMLTWESWNTSVHGNGPNAPYAQPAFAPSKIAGGAYDAYITAAADAIKSLGANCPVALRLDQEPNGYWYPWGITTVGMGGTVATRAADYIKMWQHVWNIFNKQGVTNVIWTWSPNYQGPKHPTLPDLKVSYPGAKYVDWIGIDAYYNSTGMTWVKLIDPTVTQIISFANDKPLILAETAVGSFSDKPAMISNMLSNALRRTRFNGFVYFDEHFANTRNIWPFQQTTASLNAFKTGIKGYAAGKPGSL